MPAVTYLSSDPTTTNTDINEWLGYINQHGFNNIFVGEHQVILRSKSLFKPEIRGTHYTLYYKLSTSGDYQVINLPGTDNFNKIISYLIGYVGALDDIARPCKK